MRLTMCLSMLLALATVPTSAAEVDDASLLLDFGYGHSRSTSGAMQAVLEAEAGVELAFAEAISLTASLRARADAEDELEPGRVNVDSYAPASRPIELGTVGSVELRDFYLEARLNNGIVRFGKQQIVWGRLDGIKVLDLANPQNFREFILDDFGESRIGLWSAYLDYTLGDWRAELALIVDGSGHAIPDRGAWFELTAPRFRFGAQPDQDGLPVRIASPGHGLSDSGYGLRLSRQFQNIELAFVGYSGNDPEPLGRVQTDNGEAVVERYFERRDAFGASVDMGLGGVVMRAEYVYQPDRVFNTRTPLALDTVALDFHRGAIGLDINGPFETFINAQYLVDSVVDAPTDLVRPDSDQIATLYLRRSFAYDAVTVAVRWYHSFTDDDDLASVSIDYAINDALALGLSAEWFSGTEVGLFGQFADRDRIVLSARYLF